mmetsp:Transcript_9267/g.28638  ORF Transcript_9267/g.28638 Transcript_9267/m.28638 type:complete len:288 (-) Transcript_9267:827-1690(-)
MQCLLVLAELDEGVAETLAAAVLVQLLHVAHHTQPLQQETARLLALAAIRLVHGTLQVAAQRLLVHVTGHVANAKAIARHHKVGVAQLALLLLLPALAALLIHRVQLQEGRAVLLETALHRQVQVARIRLALLAGRSFAQLLGLRTIHSLRDAQTASVQDQRALALHVLERLACTGLAAEHHEGGATRTARVTILHRECVLHTAEATKQVEETAVRRRDAHVLHKDTATDRVRLAVLLLALRAVPVLVVLVVSTASLLLRRFVVILVVVIIILLLLGTVLIVILLII